MMRMEEAGTPASWLCQPTFQGHTMSVERRSLSATDSRLISDFDRVHPPRTRLHTSRQRAWDRLKRVARGLAAEILAGNMILASRGRSDAVTVCSERVGTIGSCE
jgi:hypothetical protein